MVACLSTGFLCRTDKRTVWVTPEKTLSQTNCLAYGQQGQQFLILFLFALLKDHPELDTRFTSLQDIIFRTNPSKKSSKSGRHLL